MKVIGYSIAVVVASLLLAFFTASTLEPGTQIPVHWNIYGEIDNYADASWVLFGVPVFMTFMLILNLVLKYIEPRVTHLQQSRGAINILIFCILLFMFSLEIAFVFITNGYEVPMVKIVVASTGLLFVMMGNYFGKLRSNFFVGIKTPWTLSSDEVWQKTHRLAGKLAVGAGLITMTAIWFVEPVYAIALVLGLLLPSMLIPVFYSWFLWNHLPKNSGQ